MFVWRSQGNRGSVISPVLSIWHVRAGVSDDETAKNCAEHGKIHSGASLLLLEKLNELDFDDEADRCERLHEDAERLHSNLLALLTQK